MVADNSHFHEHAICVVHDKAHMQYGKKKTLAKYTLRVQEYIKWVINNHSDSCNIIHVHCMNRNSNSNMIAHE